MILQILLMFISGAAGILLINVASIMLKTYLAMRKFKSESRGIPIVQGFNLFGGHLNTRMFGKRIWKVLHEDHMYGNGKTGAWFYCDRPAISTCDLDLIKRIVVTEANLHECRITEFGFPMKELEVDNIMTAVGGQWRRLRRATAPAFAAHKVKSENVQAEMGEVLNKLIESIENRIDKSDNESTIVDIESVAHRYALAMVFTCFYKQDNLIDFNSDSNFFQKILEEGSEGLTSLPVKLSVILPMLRPFVQWFLLNFHPQGKMRKKILKFVLDQAKANLEARKQIQQDIEESGSGIVEKDNLILKDGSKYRRNMIDYVIDQYHDGKLTLREYLHNVNFLIYAGNKTSADAISKLVYHLAKYPDIQEKCRQSILASGIESEYLLWCINESLRLFPPILNGASRTISQQVETSDGGVIPKGTFILTPAYTIHRLPEYWGHDAEEYRPERWIEAEKFHPMQFIPFGGGPRSCPGMHFAMHEMKLLIGALLRRYKLEYIPGTNNDMMFETPFFIFCTFDGPTNIKISRLQ